MSESRMSENHSRLVSKWWRRNVRANATNVRNPMSG